MKRLNLIAVFLSLPFFAFASDSLNVYRSSSLYNYWSNTADITVDGQYLYHTGVDGELSIFDFESNDLDFVGSSANCTNGGQVDVNNGLAAIGTYDANADEKGYHLVNVENPQNPQYQGLFDEHLCFYDLQINNSYLYTDSYAVNYGRRLKTYHIINDQPELISSLGVASMGQSSEFFIYENTLILITNLNLQYYSLEDPGNPNRIAIISTGLHQSSATIMDNKLFIIGEHHDIDGLGMVIYDLTNPDSITYLDNYYFLPQNFDEDEVLSYKISSDEDNIYLYTKMRNYDGEDVEINTYLIKLLYTNRIEVYSSSYWQEGATDFLYDNEKLCFAGESISRFDFLWGYTAERYPEQLNHNIVKFNDSRIILGDVPRNWQYLIDVSNPFNIIELDKDGLNAENCQLAGDLTDLVYPYAAQLSGSILKIYEYDEFINDELLSIIDLTPITFSEIHLNLPYLYLFDSFRGRFVIYDLSNPSNPDLVSSIIVPDNDEELHTCCIYGENVYISQTNTDQSDPEGTGIVVLDISNPTQPVATNFIEMDYPNYRISNNITAENGILYVTMGRTDYELGFVASFSLEDPDNPDQLDVLFHGEDLANCMDITDDRMMLAGDSTIFIIDISNPEEMFIDGWYESNRTVNAVKIIDNGYYAVDDYSLYCFQLGAPSGIERTINIQTPDDFSISYPWPNPFNSFSRFSYKLNKYSDIHLAVYNINGQLVNTLFSGRQSAGIHQAVWNGKNASGVQVASGQYFIRMADQGNVVTQKILFIK